ncbi:MAG: alpha/beta hydrolase [Candidatus Omnitrophica bacterium]|nr:alpha/beta hydrolase [Candidatus Omnitrophota bacterium]
MPFIETPRKIKWHYETSGEGSCLLFLHGWASSSRVFAQQAEYFSQKNKVILIDLPGHGLTSWQPVSFSEIVYDIEAILNTLNVDSLNIVGSSMGGMIGLKFYGMFPQRVKRLVMAGSVPKFLQSPGMPVGLKPQEMQKLRAQVVMKYPGILDIFFRSLFTLEERETEKFKWIHQFRKEENFPSQEALIYYLDLLEKEDLVAILKNIKIPVQFISGRHDYICSADSMEFLKVMLSYAQFNFIEKSGHFPFLIRSVEFNQEVEKFLTKER